ncbi:MAG: PSD1 and planctomycete cytochrome C domain-containing protein [Blastocatellia bacterium]
MPKMTGNISKVLILFAACAALALASQQPDRASDLFKQKVAPILEQHCVVCHGARVQRSGLDLRTEQAIIKGGARGPAITPGKPEASRLYRMIAHTEEPAMPLGRAKLPDTDIAAIAEWIAGLAPNVATHAAETIPVRAPGYSVTARDREFWSFEQPVRPAVPQVKNQAWVRNEIDAFILKRLEDNQLSPAPPAEPRVLLRRLYFDLIGLPPSPEELNEFLKDPSDAAYEKVLDRLLGSPHYGERWGRHWLDLARYADSGGYEFDVDRPHAWRYRDWVIKAFNADKPYDQFIREQLAGDQLSAPDDPKEAEKFQASPEALIPTAFCRNGPTVDNANNEQTRSDELDDMVTTTSSVFLGLTVGCARCHDHKYDPIPQRDYYRMQAVFFPFQKTQKLLVSDAEEKAWKAQVKAIDDQQIRPLKEKLAALEKPVREKLLADKVEFHVRLAESAGTINDATREQYRKETAKRFAKDVNLQPEEIESLLSPDDVKTWQGLKDEMERVNQTKPKPLPAVMGVTDNIKKPGQAYLLKRGDISQKAEPVEPGLPTVLAGDNNLSPLNRRRQMAAWIANAENPLTARVAVNRIWQYHFGRGIVRTPSDFGATGDRPSHPELLDWLATEFIRRGWSWKAMHRLMLTSNAYKQSGRYDAQAAAKDPDNRLLWRSHPRRLEAEAVRDSILIVSGKLNREMYGPGIYPRISPDIINTGSRPRWPLDAKEEPKVWRRSVYIYVKRSVLLPLIEVFDCPVTTVSAPVRAVSTVSPQALALMNNEFVLEQADYFAQRLEREAGQDRRAQITRAFLIALGRAPNAKELEWSEGFLTTQADGYAKRQHEKPDSAALRDFCHAILNLNEFLYVD